MKVNVILKLREIFKEENVSRDFMRELQLGSFSVDCLSCALSRRPNCLSLFDNETLPIKFKGSGVRIKMADDCGKLVQWGRESGEMTQELRIGN